MAEQAPREQMVSVQELAVSNAFEIAARRTHSRYAGEVRPAAGRKRP